MVSQTSRNGSLPEGNNEEKTWPQILTILTGK